MDATSLLRELTRRHTPHEGIFQTPLAGVTLIRGDSPSAPTPLLYTPRLCIGIEGDKELAVGDTLVHLPARIAHGSVNATMSSTKR